MVRVTIDNLAFGMILRDGRKVENQEEIYMETVRTCE